MRLPPLSVIAALQLAYGVPSGFFGVGRLRTDAFPTISAEKGTFRQSVVKNGTFFSGCALRRSQGVLRRFRARSSARCRRG